jgi:uncharacterized protein DUF4156
VTRTALGLLCLLLLAGCVSLTPEGERVRVVRNPNAVQACTKLGDQLESISGWGGVFLGGAGLENNKATLRNQAAKLGGDTLLILQERATYAPQTYAEAYRCTER